MKLYFVYAIPQLKKLSFFVRLLRKMKKMVITFIYLKTEIQKRQYDKKFFDDWPIQSPYENTKNIYLGLSKYWPSYLFHLTEKCKLKIKEDDIFIGHPFFPISGIKKGITEIVLSMDKKPKTTVLITPLHCNLSIQTSHINRDYLNHVNELVPRCDLLFSIMGQYWWDQWKYSEYSHWLSKMIRLDMAIDIKHYPKIKKRFNQKGKRKFLFIGRNDPMKGTEFLSQLANQVPQFHFGWIGSGNNIEGIHRISDFRELTPKFMSHVAEEYDFFISTSLADPNPTTILEALAWGFPVLSTKQSGYYQSKVFTNIFSENLEETKNIIFNFEEKEESELLGLSKLGRQLVASDYNWNKFNDVIISNLKKHYY